MPETREELLNHRGSGKASEEMAFELRVNTKKGLLHRILITCLLSRVFIPIFEMLIC